MLKSRYNLLDGAWAERPRKRERRNLLDGVNGIENWLGWLGLAGEDDQAGEDNDARSRQWNRLP